MDLIAQQCQEVSAGHTGGAGAHDADALAVGGQGLHLAGLAFGKCPISHKSLDITDGNGSILGTTVALALAGVVADAAADRREGIGLEDQVIGFLKSLVTNQAHIATHICVGRTSVGARRCLGFAQAIQRQYPDGLTRALSLTAMAANAL